MPRAKIPRKSTSVDMTAMCDVAFLLLSFFILTTKFKPAEALEVTTPNSVANLVAPSSNVVLITIDKNGKVFFSMSDDLPKNDLILKISQRRGLNLTETELENFKKAPFVGVPFSKLKSFLQKTPEQQSKIIEGIPVDSTNNEMMDWMGACNTVFQGRKMNLLLKGDNDSKYPSFQGVINAFKGNDFMKFQIVTNPEGVPIGSELYKANMTREKK
jgi:biopolymer transport protein ExbD